MGVPADLFIASESELTILLDEIGSPVSKLCGIADSGVDLVMLCTLEEILTGAGWENVFDAHYVCPLKDDGPEGPWVYGISQSLQDALVRLQPPEMSDCAASWADTDDWTVREDCSLPVVLETLKQLASLALRAEAQGKRVFLWTAI